MIAIPCAHTANEMCRPAGIIASTATRRLLRAATSLEGPASEPADMSSSLQSYATFEAQIVNRERQGRRFDCIQFNLDQLRAISSHSALSHGRPNWQLSNRQPRTRLVVLELSFGLVVTDCPAAEQLNATQAALRVPPASDAQPHCAAEARPSHHPSTRRPTRPLYMATLPHRTFER